MPQIALSGVAVEFGATRLLDDVTVGIERGDRWGIIGRNGSGKTTIFRLIQGVLQPTRGQVIRETGLRIAELDQHREFGAAGTIWEAAAGPFADLLALERSLGEQAHALGENPSAAMLDRFSRDQERFEREGGYQITPRVDAVLHGLGFDPDIARTRLVSTLSGGERGRLGLACQLVAPADMLLLDEPTNHLDLETIDWLEEYLRQLSITVLVISHDRTFLQHVTDHVLHVEAGTTASYTGDYEAFLLQRNERRLTQQRAYQKQQSFLASEEDFIRRNIAGQNTSQAKGRRRRLQRVSRLSPPPESGAVMSLKLETTERSGDQALVVDKLQVGVEGRTLLKGFSARLLRGDVVGLIGPNGAGKSTLLRTLLGEREPEAGEARLGSGVRAAYYRQDMGQVPTEETLYNVIADLRPHWNRGQIQGHLGRFGFSGDSVQRIGRTLSGGERARVALAMLMLSGANLLVFDEPTNHLDVESIEALEDAITEYDGTVLLVSHDRALLEALATRVWILHDTRITDFDGSFAEWEVVSTERAHAARVAAVEEEARQRVEERRRTGNRQDGRKEQQNQQRVVRRRLEAAEVQVETLERRLQEINAALGDPDLYTRDTGAQAAAELGRELDLVKQRLESAYEEWTQASAAVEGSPRS
ncbi:MAG TPA: ABC-F family ATP-binding cassette domain-containing protein [Gemmatimonadales bacterium]|jgi:ATP-binding cassette subfamily F protein 3|nr:ABC-F family ATP-binding cassette domain-containing protein [Gemmatimonadales bacterium]